MGSMIVLSGPSCVGKGPLCAALRQFYPELARNWQSVVLYNSRAPRPGEKDGVDYRFRPRQTIEEMRHTDGYEVQQVRNDLQAIDVRELAEMLDRTDVFFEGNPVIARMLIEIAQDRGTPVTSVFLAPLSRAEILELQAPERHVVLPDFVKEVMQRKLLRRTHKQNTILSLADLRDIEVRATSAYEELAYASLFDAVIANHDGEDSENWDAFYYPVGDARRTLIAFAALLRGEDPAEAEHWEDGLPGG